MTKLISEIKIAFLKMQLRKRILKSRKDSDKINKMMVKLNLMEGINPHKRRSLKDL